MPKRKTIEVETLKRRVNKYLTLDTLNQVEKSALCHILETILQDTGNYQGFSYLFDWNGLGETERQALQFNRKYN